MKKLLICLLCILPIAANAKIIYRVQQTGIVPGSGVESKDTFASEYAFYVGAMYNLSMWQNYMGDTQLARGRNTSGFDALVGFRFYDMFRLEADYTYSQAKWDIVAMNTNTMFVNAIFDARIDSLYRFFHKQKLVPYVGVGTGLTWYRGKDTTFKQDTNLSLAVLAGLGIELGEYFTLDIGYRYIYMFKPEVSVMPELVPSAHQVRIGARVNF